MALSIEPTALADVPANPFGIYACKAITSTASSRTPVWIVIVDTTVQFVHADSTREYIKIGEADSMDYSMNTGEVHSTVRYCAPRTMTTEEVAAYEAVYNIAGVTA